MQGEGNRGQSTSPPPSQENTGESTDLTQPQPSGEVPAYSPENEIDMPKGGGEVKRDQAEPKENSNHEKWKKREGIKRRLQDEPTPTTTPPQVQCQSINQRTRYICMRGLEE